MKVKRSIIEDSSKRFALFCDMSDRRFLSISMLLLSLALFVGFWWADRPLELIAPWLRGDWAHGVAWVYVFFLSLVAASMLSLIFFLQDRRHTHTILFDADQGEVHTEELVHGERVDITFDLDRFVDVEIHSVGGNSGGDQRWMLAAILDNGSYWQLLDGDDRHAMETIAEKLRTFFSPSHPDPPHTKHAEAPPSAHLVHEDNNFLITWPNRTPLITKVFSLCPPTLMALASVVPLLATFEGNLLYLLPTLAAATAVFWTLQKIRSPKDLLIAFVFWISLVMLAIFVFQAHWAYFPIASLGLGLTTSMAASFIISICNPPSLSLEIDLWGVVYHNGVAAGHDDDLLRVQNLEGAVANIRPGVPPSIWFLPPGNQQKNIDRCIGRDLPADDEKPRSKQLFLASTGSFERCAIAFLLDDEIQRRHESDDKITIKPPA